MANFIIPIVSMRRHSDDTYELLKDGNLQLHLARADKGDYICVPYNSADLLEVRQLFTDFNFVECEYGINAYDTRKRFYEMNDVDSLVSNTECTRIITDVTGYKGNYPFINNFNITKDADNPLPYIDEFIDIDVDSVNRSLYTVVLNERQRASLVWHCADARKIIVSKQVINSKIYERYFGLEPINIDGIFFPFRLTDQCYQFENVVKFCRDKGQKLVITDPNDSFDKFFFPDTDIELRKFTKNEYYRVLMSKPTIIYKENPERCFHPGLGELIYFGCDIICDAELPDISELIVQLPFWK